MMIDLGDLGRAGGRDGEGGGGGGEEREGGGKEGERGGEGTYNERRQSRVECKLILNLVHTVLSDYHIS